MNKKAKALLKILFTSGYLKMEYGELRTCGTNNGIACPLTKEECEWLCKYFKGELL